VSGAAAASVPHRVAVREIAGEREKLLTVEDLCELLVVSKDFIYDEVRHGRLRASRIARQLRFRPADVDSFIEASVVTGGEF
jgi:excisionase family DNA binding protein